jgi:putative ABC transport system permease protein
VTAAAGPAARSRNRSGLADHLYGLLVLAYPAELRDEFGEDMIGMFRAQRRAAGKNPLRRARLWMLALADVAVHAARARRDALPAPEDERDAARPERGTTHPHSRRHGDPYGRGPRGNLAHGLRALADDLRYACRTLVRQPKLTALAVLILTLGVGTSTAVFGVVDATLLRPLPYAQADRLVDLWMHLPDGGFTVNGIALESVRAWRQQRAIFEQVEGYDTSSVVILGAGEPERSAGAWISPGLLPLLGASPARGRGFGADDVTSGAAPVALISEGMWRRRFGAAANVVGRELRLDDDTYTIVGVLPDAFRFPSAATDVWRPLPMAPSPQWEDGTTINAVGRLHPGMTPERAQELADAASEELADVVASPYVKLRPWNELRALPDTRSSLLMLLGAVGFLVLIATANLANLLLAQATTRHEEIAVRVALGAARARVARQLLLESALLALLGGALGALLASSLLRVSMTRMPASIVYRLADEIGVDGRAMLFAVAVSLAIGLAMGLLPALGCARGAPRAALTGGRGASTSRRHTRIRSALVVAEVGLSLLLLVGAGLMVNSFARLQSIDPGFDPDNLLLVQLRLDTNRYATEGERIRFVDELDALVEALHGVVGATVGGDAPPVPGGVSVGVAPQAEGMPAAPVEDPVLPYGRVAADYFDVVGIPFIAGGTFVAPSRRAAPSIVINETVADHFWGDTDPVGKRFRLDADAEWRTVVGVVRDVRAGSPDDPYGSMEVYYPFDPAERAPAYRTLTVRTRDDPMALVEAIKSQVWSLDTEQPVSFQRATDVLAGRVEVPRFYLQLIGAFALIAAGLAAFGLYGVLSYSVGQRLREIGIRMALGESERDVLRRVVRGGLLLAAIGVVLGLAGATVLTHYLESLLYEVRPVDPPTFATAGALMLLIAALSCYLPARRATRVDPVEVLRAQ